jgi:hypothetical protein
VADSPRQYPDNSGIHARKAEGRRERALLPFSEKLDALDALRDGVEPIIRAREARRRQGHATGSNDSSE